MKRLCVNLGLSQKATFFRKISSHNLTINVHVFFFKVDSFMLIFEIYLGKKFKSSLSTMTCLLTRIYLSFEKLVGIYLIWFNIKRKMNHIDLILTLGKSLAFSMRDMGEKNHYIIRLFLSVDKLLNAVSISNKSNKTCHFIFKRYL